MIQHGRPSVTPVQTRLHKSSSHLFQKKIFHSLICLSAWPQSSVVPHPFAPFLTVRSSGNHAVPFHPSPATPRALASRGAHLRSSHLRRSLPRRPSVAHRRQARRALNLPWPLGHTCRGASCLPWLSQGCPRNAARHRFPPRRPELTGSGLPRSYLANVCFKCFRCFRGIL
jgi:hypothetical protein